MSQVPNMLGTVHKATLLPNFDLMTSYSTTTYLDTTCVASLPGCTRDKWYPSHGPCVLGCSHLALASCLEIFMLLLLCSTNLLCSVFVDDDSTTQSENGKKELTEVLKNLSSDDAEDSADLTPALVEADEESPMMGFGAETPPGGIETNSPLTEFKTKVKGVKKIPLKKGAVPGVSVMLLPGGSRQVSAAKKTISSSGKTLRGSRPRITRPRPTGFGRKTHQGTRKANQNSQPFPRRSQELALFEKKWVSRVDRELIERLLSASAKHIVVVFH